MKYVGGDLITMAMDGEFDVIIHGCNCQNIMGAGIAAQIKHAFPEAFDADTRAYHSMECVGGDYSVGSADGILVYNAYTQIRPGSGVGGVDDSLARLRFIEEAFTKILKVTPTSARIGIPKIGAGLGGGDWKAIEAVIARVGNKHDITCIVYEH